MAGMGFSLQLLLRVSQMCFPMCGPAAQESCPGVLWLSSIHFYTDIGQTSTSKEGRTIWSVSRAGFESGLSTDRFCPSYPDVYVSPLSSVGLFLRADFSLSHRSAFSCSFIGLLLFSVKKLDLTSSLKES